MEGIIKLNRTLSSSLRLPILTFDDFKKLHSHKSSQESLDAAIAHIAKVYKHQIGYEFIFDNGEVLQVYFSGHMRKNHMKPVRNLDKNNGRIRITQFNGYNTSMYPEKLVGIAELILRNEMPNTFDGLSVNVMDGSGRDSTAIELGIPYNIYPDNLEWTLCKRNSRHGAYIRKLADITGHVYRYRANDATLYQALDLKKRNEDWIRSYMERHYSKVK